MHNKSWYCMYGEPFGIGATAHAFYLEDKLVVVDWGIGFGRTADDKHLRYLPQGDFLKGEYVDLFVITHGHGDHIGAAPRFVREHPEAIVVISKKTLEASPIIFKDCIKRMRSDVKEGIIDESEIIFNFKDVKNFYNNNNLYVVDQDGWSAEDDPWPGWQIGFHKAGHDVGAESFFIITPQNKRLMTTGDICSQNQRVLPGVMLPDEDFLGDFLDKGELTLITEGTNAGRRKSKERSVIEREIIEVVKKTAARGGVILIPCFGKNRTAEAIHILVSMGFRPHVEGMGQKLSVIESPEIKDMLDNEQVIFFQRDRDKFEEENKHRQSLRINDDPCDRGPCTIDGQYFEKEPCIVVSSSATLEGGHAVSHAIDILPGERNSVIFIGHIFEHTVAKQIKEIQRGRTVKLKNFDKEFAVNVRCEIYHFDLTAHDYQESLVERARLMNRSSKLKRVIVHHCPGQKPFELFKNELENLPNPPQEVVYGTQMRRIEI